MNGSLLTGIFPTSYKVSSITPLIKKPGIDANSLNNYRPISNLKFISKVVERAASAQLQDYMFENELYGRRQSAYRKHFSTETALVRVQNDILRAVDQHADVVLVLLDLSAAFDTVDHKILLQRLRDRYGITGDALAWCTSYLTGRKQSVVIGDKVSATHVMDCSVPQGSVAGPFMFTVYAAPLEDVIRSYGVEVMIYADDTQLYLVLDPTSDNPLKRLEDCIRGVKAWTTENKLLLNDSKTEVLHLSSRFVRNPTHLSTIGVGDAEVDIASEVRNLGALMDQHMTLKSHVNKVCRAACLAISKIGRIRRYIDRSTAERLIHAFVTSRLDANNSLLYGLPKSEISKLQRVQNSAVRLALGICGKHRSGISDLRRDELHWLPVQDRIVFKILMITYKSLNGLAPPYLKELLTSYQPSRTLRSSTQALLEIPRTVSTITYGERAFSVSAPKLWNALPQQIRSAKSLATFKKLLKTHLFNNPSI